VDIFAWTNLGRPLVYLAFECVLYMGLVMLLETKAALSLAHAVETLRVRAFFRLGREGAAGEGADEDVAAEEQHARELHERLAAAGAPWRPRAALESAAVHPTAAPSLDSLEAPASEAASLWADATILLDRLEKVYPPPLGALVPSCGCGACCRCCCGSGPKHRDDGADGGDHSMAKNGAAAAKKKSRKIAFKHAVKGVSLAVPQGECFGFLGTLLKHRFFSTSFFFFVRVAHSQTNCVLH
jgi:hypothetical protein